MIMGSTFEADWLSIGQHPTISPFFSERSRIDQHEALTTVVYGPTILLFVIKLFRYRMHSTSEKLALCAPLAFSIPVTQCNYALAFIRLCLYLPHAIIFHILRARIMFYGATTHLDGTRENHALFDATVRFTGIKMIGP